MWLITSLYDAHPNGFVMPINQIDILPSPLTGVHGEHSGVHCLCYTLCVIFLSIPQSISSGRSPRRKVLSMSSVFRFLLLALLIHSTPVIAADYHPTVSV